MSTDNVNLWGGFQSDEDESLKIQPYDGVKFGLNQSLTLKRVEYTTLTGSGGTEGNPALIIEFNDVGSSKYINLRLYNPESANKLYYRGKEVFKGEENFNNALKDESIRIKSVITHFLKACGRTQQEINTATATVASFEDLAKISSTLMADAITQKKPIDLFMHYQASIRGTADKTYLEMPDNLAFGSFVTPHETPVGEWKEVKEWEEKEEEGLVIKKGLAYVDNAGNFHRFKRDESYMKGKRANQQTLGSPSNPLGNTSNGVASAAQSEWDN